MKKLPYDKYPDDCDDDYTADCRRRGEDTQIRVFITVGLLESSPILQHHSLCSILTFGGLRKDRFFFSLLFLPLAWKVLQLSTRPSLVSWQMCYKKIVISEMSQTIKFTFLSESLQSWRNAPQSFSAILSLAWLSLLPRFLPLLPFSWEIKRTFTWFGHLDMMGEGRLRFFKCYRAKTRLYIYRVSFTFHACPLLPFPSSWFQALRTASWSACTLLA